MRGGLILLALAAGAVGIGLAFMGQPDDTQYVITQPTPISVEPMSFDRSD